jgi:hypothetical protein
MRRTVMKKFLFIGLAVLVALLGCNLFNRDFYRTAEDFPENGKGMLVLILDGSDIGTHTVGPPTSDLDIVSYKISGTHISNTTFSESKNKAELLVSGTVYSKNDLLPGAWTIEVEAYNVDKLNQSGATRLGYGSTGIIVQAGTTIDGSVVVGPDTGIIPGSSPVAYYTGLLTLDIEWPPNAVSTPKAVANLTEGTPGTQDYSYPDTAGWASDSEGTTLADQTVKAGYYTLNMKLYTGTVDAANLIMGDTEVIRIVSGLGTTALFDLSGTKGQADITITPDLNDPVVVAMDTSAWPVVKANLPQEASGYFTYEWYEDGTLISAWSGDATTSLTTDTTPSYNHTVSSSFTAGTTHRLSIVVTKYDTAAKTTVIKMGSYTYEFEAPGP